jgi:ceramide glucosyltransferase
MDVNPFGCITCLLELAAIIGCTELVLAAGLVQLYVRRRVAQAPPSESFPPVSILVPLHGYEPDLFERLAAFCSQDYAGSVQLVLGTRNSAAVIGTVQRLQTAFPQVRIKYVADIREHGSSRKFSTLINMIPFVDHNRLVFADSDVRAGPHYLRDLMGELDRPGVAAVSCLYRERSSGTFWSRLSALGINGDYLPQIVVALTCRLIRPCFGPTIAIRLETLQQIGGLSRFVDYLGADYLIGQAVHAIGGKVVIARFTIECAALEHTAAEFFARKFRLGRTIKAIRPLSYTGTLFTYPLTLSLLAALLDSPIGFLLAVAAVSCRMLLYYSVERAFAPERTPYYLIPIYDLIAFAVFVASFFGQTISWRGHKYRVSPSLRMVQVNTDAKERY